MERLERIFIWQIEKINGFNHNQNAPGGWKSRNILNGCLTDQGDDMYLIFVFLNYDMYLIVLDFVVNLTKRVYKFKQYMF